jgi:PAS domain S-box-containing protein
MLAELLAIAADALVVVDSGLRVVLFSPGAERIFELPRDQILGQPLDRLLPESVREIHRAHIEDFARSGIPALRMNERGCVRARKSDGSEFPAEASIARIEVDGEIYYAAVLRDLSDRERTESELRRSEAELAEAQHLAQIGSWEWEIADDIVRWSAELRRIFQYQETGDLSYAEFLDRVHPDDRTLADAAVERALLDDMPYANDYRILRSDGTVRVIHARGRLLRDANGKPLRMLGTAQDVTEQRGADERAQELLRQQAAHEAAQAAAARFRFLAEASQILNSSLDIEETLRSVTQLAIPAIADWCSLDLVGDAGELRRVDVAHADPEKVRIAQEIHRRFPPDTAADAPGAAPLRRGEPLLIEDFSEAMIQIATRDEEHRALLRALHCRSAICAPLIARNRLVGLITLATAESGRRLGADDVSLAQSLAERAALAIDNARLFERAKAAASAREDAVATVSHDLRSPLGVLGINLTLLREPGLAESERAQALDRMQRAVDSMQRLISDLLDVTRLEAGAIAMRRRVCLAEEVIHDACELETPAASTASVRFAVDVEPRLRLYADPDRIVQVISNLVSNAIRHSPAGGCVQVTARSARAAVLVSVVDAGPGVPEETRDRIFQRFWQNEPQHRGTAGLGLAIARALVEAHGGRIWTEPAPGGGACFSFTLPRRPDATVR